MKRRVLALVPLPPPYSGPEVSSKVLFSKPFKDVEVSIINTSIKKDKFKRGKITFGSILRYVLFYLRYILKLLFGRYDVVYHCITATKLGWIRDASVLLPAYLMRRKTLLHMRGGHFHVFYESIKDTLMGRIVHKLVSSSSGVIVQSPSLKEQFENLVDDGRIHVLPNAFEEMFLEIHPQRDRLRILFVGLLTTAKGYHHVVNVARRMLDEYDEIEFIFLGERMREETNIFYDQLTGRRIEHKPFVKLEHERVIYIERAIGEDKKRIYERSSIFVLPSYSEGFSMAVLEAMASALAIITTPVGANRDILKHMENSILIPTGDEESLYTYMKLLVEDSKLRRKLGENARKTALENFHPDKVRKMLERILKEV